MPDKWAKYAQPAPSSNKWAQYAEQAPAQTAAPAPQQGFLSSAADASGLSGLLHAVAHPIDTVAGIPTAVKASYQNTVQNVKQGVQDYHTQGLSQQTRRDFGKAIPVLGPAFEKAKEQEEAGNEAGAAGTVFGLAGGLIAPLGVNKVAPVVAPAIARTIDAVGEAGQDAGIGLMNKTVGTLKNDFKHGANPARGYFGGGGGPALSMSGVADQAENIANNTGRALRSAYARSNAVIPAEKVFDAAATPVGELRAAQSGFGGTGISPSVKAYEDNLLPTLINAEARGGFSPAELFDQAKRPLAKNTNWKDPTMLDLNTVRQQTTGAIGGLLTDAVPGTADMNQIYQGAAKMADRAQYRADTHSAPLTTLAGKTIYSGLGGALGAMGGAHEAVGGALLGLAADSVPVKTTLASGLYYGGKGLRAIAPNLGTVPPLNPALVAVPAYSMVGKKRDTYGQ